MELIQQIREKAKKLNKRIVLPESHDERTLQAANIAYEERLATVILIGNKEKVLSDAERLGLKNIKDIEIVDYDTYQKINEYADLMVELRNHKGLNKGSALELLKNPLYLAVLMIKSGDADGEVAGAANATGNVLLPAFQYVKTAPGISVVSGTFLMFVKDEKFGHKGLLLFADCAVHPDPTAAELAEIAVSTGKTARRRCPGTAE